MSRQPDDILLGALSRPADTWLGPVYIDMTVQRTAEDERSS